MFFFLGGPRVLLSISSLDLSTHFPIVGFIPFLFSMPQPDLAFENRGAGRTSFETGTVHVAQFFSFGPRAFAVPHYPLSVFDSLHL